MLTVAVGDYYATHCNELRPIGTTVTY